MSTGVIFDIKEFAIYDGPGIRQTVFLKGCPLSCRWCHNPEGQLRRPQIMASRATCPVCHYEQYVWECERCCHCGAVLPVLPRTVGEEITPAELERRLRRHSDYYARYGGGVTFSGGEPLMQPAFLLEVLTRISDLHCAIETSGYCCVSTFAEIVAKLDFVMMDLKIFDDRIHQKYTGKSNAKILHNAGQLCAGNTPFVIRVPLIPGVSDTEENLRSIASFLQGAKALERVELLPYHRTAGAKYPLVGMTYSPGFDEASAVHASTAIFNDYGIRSAIL